MILPGSRVKVWDPLLYKNMEREGEVSNYDPHELIDQWRGVSVPVSIVWI